MFGNLMAIYLIMLQFIQNHSRFVMLMIIHIFINTLRIFMFNVSI